MSDRSQAMTEFLDAYFSTDYQVVSLAGDASFRRYHRIFVGEKSYLLMDAPPEKERVDDFVKVAIILSDKVNVPDILASDIANGFLLLQDFGEVEFAHLIDPSTDNDALYQKALETLALLQEISIDKLDIAPYSDDKYLMETALFDEWFLPYIQESNDQALWQRLNEVLIKDIQSQPKVLVHRDYHSRNLMQDKNSDRLGVIDFQDALIGAYTYDLVSLVRDAYIDVDEAWVNKQILKFYGLIRPNCRENDFIKSVNIMGVQRHLKVLGIFVRLSQRDGKNKYLANIPKVFNDLMIELHWLNENQADKVYGEFLAFIKKIAPSYEQVFLSSSTNKA